ncbi:MAG: S-layer homology domain-containing protein [Oscillospiraceae bacterium]|nr:S-layer homology domain-containing protein [Oscillospiraceae bacterium]
MKRIISVITVVFILLTQAASAKDYSDYPQRFWDLPKDHWAYSYISELTDKNVISGYDDGSFKPEATVSRAEWSKIMSVASGKQEVKLENNGSYAVDYNSNDWYYGYINSVADYMNFYNENGSVYFKPNQAISREDVTVSLVKLKGYSVSAVDYSYITKFEDFNSISNDLKKYVAVAIEKELISGYEDNTFRGQDTLTRAEAATLLWRAFQLGNDNKVSASNTVIEPSNVGSNVSNETNKGNGTNDPKNDLKVFDDSSVNNKNKEVDEEKEDKKPYKIETLAKVNITSYNGSYSWLFYAQDENDNIYYYDVDTHDIVKINMVTRKKEILENSDTIKISYDGKEYANMTVEGIFYDSYSDSLAVYGSFSGGKASFENKPAPFYCIVELNDLSVTVFEDEDLRIWFVDGWLPHYMEDFTFWGVLNNGDYLVYEPRINSEVDHDFIISRRSHDIEEFKVVSHGSSNFYAPYKEYNGKIYYVGFGYNGLYYTDGSKNTKISSMSFRGISHDKAYALGSNSIGVFTLDGEVVKQIKYEEIEIKDNNKIDPKKVNDVLLASSNDDIVFYDTWMQAFRIISENK